MRRFNDELAKLERAARGEYADTSKDPDSRDAPRKRGREWDKEDERDKLRKRLMATDRREMERPRPRRRYVFEGLSDRLLAALEEEK